MKAYEVLSVERESSPPYTINFMSVKVADKPTVEFSSTKEVFENDQADDIELWLDAAGYDVTCSNGCWFITEEKRNYETVLFLLED